jgi:hypothetical protein
VGESSQHLLVCTGVRAGPLKLVGRSGAFKGRVVGAVGVPYLLFYCGCPLSLI